MALLLTSATTEVLYDLPPRAPKALPPPTLTVPVSGEQVVFRIYSYAPEERKRTIYVPLSLSEEQARDWFRAHLSRN